MLIKRNVAAAQFDVQIKSYRTDNGVFRSDAFQTDINKCNQDITFCGVGIHSQNGIVQLSIKHELCSYMRQKMAKHN